MTILELLQGSRWKELAAFCYGRFGVVVKPKQLAHYCRNWKPIADAQGKSCCTDWSDSTWCMWLRNRLDENAAFTAGRCPADSIWFSVELNIGFLSLNETPEMIEALQREHAVIRSSVARSKISETQEVIFPVDRVAQRVVTNAG